MSGLFHTFSRKGRENERSIYLEGWDGDKQYKTLRISREDESLDNFLITLLGGIQPKVLNHLLLAQRSTGMSDDGLTERLQLMVYPEIDSKWVFHDEEITTQDEILVYNLLDNVMEYRRRGEKLVLRFSNEAQSYFNNWLEAHNTYLRKEQGSDLLYHSHLGKYPKLIASLAGVYHLIDEFSKNNTEPDPVVGINSFRKAEKLTEVLKQHAVKVYRLNDLPDLNAARVLYQKILSGDVRAEDTIRSIYRNEWSGLKTKEHVFAALSILEKCSIARLISVKSSKGKSKQIIDINPDCFKLRTDITDKQTNVESVTSVSL